MNPGDRRDRGEDSETVGRHEPPGADASAGAPERSLLGTRAGSIRIVDFLGSGGMGEVYVGFDEKLQRKVALKALKGRRRLEPEARARFLHEARVLSNLEHPHICRIYDLIEGEDQDLLVLELIQGEPLQAVAAGSLTRGDKLRVAGEIAEVLVAAHAKGIVHRDLKPQNIMLTRDGSVKVLDFGLSRWQADPSADTASIAGEPEASGVASPDSSHPYAATRAGTIMGTLGYMSPEQAQGRPATPASDMFSFGLVLQELFSGSPPFETGLDAREALDRAARGESLPFSDQDSDLVALVNRLKAAAPGVRPSAVDVLERLRWIEQKPKRRRLRVAVTAAISVLTLTTLAMILLAIRAHRAAVRAEREAETARQVSEFLTELFVTSDPTRSSGKTVTAREILDEGSRSLKWKLNNQPEIKSTLMRTVGDVYRELGLWQEASPFLEESLAAQETLFGRESPEVALTLRSLGLMKRDLEKYDEAKALLDRALAIQEKRLGPGDVQVAYTLGCIGQLQLLQGMATEALATYQRELAIQEKARGPNDPWVARSLFDVGMAHAWLGQYEKAEQAMRRALKIDESAYGLDNPIVASDLRTLSPVYGQMGRGDEAVAAVERSLKIDEACYGPEGDKVAADLSNLSEFYRNLGRNEDSERAARRALAIDRKNRGASSALVAQDLESVAQICVARGKLGDAEDMVREAIAIRRKVQGDGHPGVAIALSSLGDICLKRAKAAEALASFSESQKLLEACLARDPQNAQLQVSMAWNSFCLGIACENLGKPEEARRHWEQAVSRSGALLKQSDDSSVLDTYAQALIYLGRLDEARPAVKKLLDRNWTYPPFVELCRKNGLLPKA